MSNSFIFNFLEQANTSFKKSWREEQDSGLIFLFREKCDFSENYQNFKFSVKTKKIPQNPAPLFNTFWMMYLFIQKSWKLGNWTNFWNFRKFSPATRISKISWRNQCSLVAHKISFRMVYNLFILTIIVMELLPF